MATYKIVLMFNMDQNGWTETYYRQADSAQAAADFGGENTDARFLNPRSNQVEFFAVRASNVDGSRESYVRYPQINNGAVGRAPGGPAAPNRDQATTCTLVRIYFAPLVGPPSVPIRNRGLWLRGCPDDWLDWDAQGKPIIANNILSAVTGYKRLLLGLGMRGRVNPPRTVYPPTQVTQMSPLPNNRDQTLISAPNLDVNITNGTRVLFGLVPRRDLPFLQGTYPVFNVVPGTSFQINYRMLQTGYSPNGLYVRRVDPVYPLITDLVPEDFRSHKTGRPTERYVGRKSASRVSH